MTGKSLYELEAEERTGNADLAAAAAASRIVRILDRAHKISGMPNKEIAERVGVSEGRVSQVLNGDGNIRISTLARLITAMGFNLKIDAVSPEGHSVAPAPLARRRRAVGQPQTPPSVRSRVELTWVTNLGVSMTSTEVDHRGVTEAVLHDAQVRPQYGGADQGSLRMHEGYVRASLDAVIALSGRDDLVAGSA